MSTRHASEVRSVMMTNPPTRRHWLQTNTLGLGTAALASLLGEDRRSNAGAPADEPKAPESPVTTRGSGDAKPPGGRVSPHGLAAKARSVIYLHMAGAPSIVDLLDHKPRLNELHGQPCPDSYVRGQKFAFLRGVPRLLGSPHKFAQHGQSGQVISELLPHLATIADDISVVRSLHTDQFNHAPAQLMIHTGAPRAGRPGMGAWVSYGLGSANRDLPTFVVLNSGPSSPDGGASLWGAGFLPGHHQGVPLRTTGEPVLFVNDPPGVSRTTRRDALDTLAQLNQRQATEAGDPEILARIAQYELAFRMQTAVPELADLSGESAATLERYGAKPGVRSFANNCLMARRLVERGVRFVQLFDWGWDSHGDNKGNDIRFGLADRCGQTDRPAAALVSDLKSRGLLDSTLVVWGGEFGRTPMNENRGGNSPWLGRDHNQHSFAMWMAGGGIKPGLSYGATDDLGYHVADKPVHIHDLQATILQLLGLDHQRLTHRFQGRDFRLTDVHGQVVSALLA